MNIRFLETILRLFFPCSVSPIFLKEEQFEHNQFSKTWKNVLYDNIFVLYKKAEKSA